MSELIKDTYGIKDQTLIYQTKDGAIEFKRDLVRDDSVWATQAQISKLFKVDQSVISRHVRNIFKDGELSDKRNMQKMHIPNSDKRVSFYSLDAILSIGYRINSGVAIEFRRWATRTLKEYIKSGFVVNKNKYPQIIRNFLRP